MLSEQDREKQEHPNEPKQAYSYGCAYDIHCAPPFFQYTTNCAQVKR